MNKKEYEEKVFQRNSPKLLKKLRESKVGIAGAGGLGSNIALALIRSGISSLVIGDFDVVEESNLNRQQYGFRHIGMKKVDALESVIKEINPFVQIEKSYLKIDRENVLDIFKECNIVVEAFDDPKSKAEIVNTVLLNTDKYIVAGNGMAGIGDCNEIVTRRVNERFYICGDGEMEYTKEVGIMAPRVIVCSGHMANIVLKILVKEGEE